MEMANGGASKETKHQIHVKRKEHTKLNVIYNLSSLLNLQQGLGKTMKWLWRVLARTSLETPHLPSSQGGCHDTIMPKTTQFGFLGGRKCTLWTQGCWGPDHVLLLQTAAPTAILSLNQVNEHLGREASPHEVSSLLYVSDFSGWKISNQIQQKSPPPSPSPPPQKNLVLFI